VIARFDSRFTEPERERDRQCFFVPKEEIVGNDYDLSVNKYKKIEYVAEEYPPTSQLLAEIDDLEAQFQKELKALKGLLKDE